MSFVYGMTDGNEGRLFADSLLTWKGDGPSNPGDISKHGLKIHVLDSNHCIGLAGDYAPCVDAIVAFSKLHDTEKASDASHLFLAKALIERCERFGDDVTACELIYLRHIRGKAELFVIRKGRPVQVPAGYIGDGEFGAALAGVLSLPPSDPIFKDTVLSQIQSDGLRVTNALDFVVRSGAYSTVAPIAESVWIRIATDVGRGFVYLASGVTMVRGSESKQASIFHLESPVFGAALYLGLKKYGLIYYSGSTDEPVRIDAPSFAEFEIRVRSHSRANFGD